MDNNKTWEALSMKDRASFIKLAMQNGYRDLDSIRSLYNNKSKEDAEGFSRWKKQIKNYKGIDVDNDNTYDYRGFYFDNPDNAWKLLEDRPDAHFTDKFKTSKHPTFSNESIYSGVKHQYNPNGIKGGKWLDDYNYIMSDDMLKASNYDISNTRKYLDEVESQHVNVYAPDGSIVMEPITVTNKYATGGPKTSKYDSLHDPVPENKKFNLDDYRYNNSWEGRINGGLYRTVTNGPVDQEVLIDNITITGKNPYKGVLSEAAMNKVKDWANKIMNGEAALYDVPTPIRTAVGNYLYGEQAGRNMVIGRDQNYGGLAMAMNLAPFAPVLAPALESITPALGRGLSKGIQLYNKYVPKSVRLGLKGIWEAYSAYDTFANLGNRAETIKDDFSKGEVLSGLWNSALVGLDLAGVAGGLYDGYKLIPGTYKMLTNPQYRRNHVYYNIAPFGYSDRIKRGKEALSSMMLDKPINVDSPKWYTEDFATDLREGYRINGELLAAQTRDDAWRIYNGIPQRHNSYIRNSDGTYSYNLNELNGQWVGFHNPQIATYDFVTGSGGGLTGNVGTLLGKDFSSGEEYYLRTIRDTWDLHPFSRPSDTFSSLLTKRLNNISKNSKFKTIVNKVVPNMPGVKWVDRKLKNLEIGSLYGGKPFEMITDVPITINGFYPEQYNFIPKAFYGVDNAKTFFNISLPEARKTNRILLSNPKTSFTTSANNLNESIFNSFIKPINTNIISTNPTKALGGPLYNEDNPIEAFQGNPYIPIVRY